MTPKEKAFNLVFNKYAITLKYPKYDNKVAIPYDDFQIVKNCALIAVYEIISELTKSVSPSVHGFRHNYWEEVKQEIEKL